MADTKPTRSSRSSSSPSPRRLLTRDQVLSALRKERAFLGLTKTADKYGLRAQQICDVLSEPPRAKLSKRMAERLSYKLYEMYEKVGG
jgi:hypothetical protein